MISAEWLSTARTINVIVCALLVLALVARGIHRIRGYFFIYVSFALLRGVTLSLVPYGRKAYATIYLATEPLTWILYVLVVIELYGGALRHFGSIAALTRWVLAGGIVLSIGVSLVSLIPDLNSAHPLPIIHVTTAIGRGVCTSLALFLLVVTAFFIAYPIPLSRNTIIHSAICSVYFLTLAAAYFVHNVVGRESWALVNLSLVMVTGATLLAWILFLKPEGERVIVRHRPQWSPDTEEQLLNRLNALNNVLARSLRK